MTKIYGYDTNIYETSIGNIKKDKEINIVMAPRGYGKCYKEYKEVIKYFENKIEQLENNIDKAIEILGNYKHYSTPTEEQNRENEDIVDNAYNILKGDKNENNRFFN